MCVLWGGGGGSFAGALTPGLCPLPAASRELPLEREVPAGSAGARAAVGASRSARPSPLRSPGRALRAGARRPLSPLSPRAIVRAPAAYSPSGPAWAPRRPPSSRGRRGRTWLYLYCFLSGSLAAQGAPRFRAASPVCSGGFPTF